jgi:hypothetical protein
MIVKNWYNGYSPKERDAKYKALKKLIKSGKLCSAIGPCDLCNDPEVNVEYHDEDYGLPYLWNKPALLCLCRTCHRSKLHKRFKNPIGWYAFIAHIRRGGYAKDLKIKSIRKEYDVYKKNLSGPTPPIPLEIIRPYKHKIGSEWFANIRMDIDSLSDPDARLR